MAGKHDLRSQDQDTSSYAALPGTEQTDFVPHNMTTMKSHLVPDREVAGSHPSRWVYELTNNDFTVCDMFERARNAKLDCTYYTWDHPHKLVINGNQSFQTPSSRVLSSICLDCHFHFVFKMAWDEAHADARCHSSQARWPLRDNQFPWHHLVWVGSVSDADILDNHSKYYPLLAREHFVCSAPPCTFQVTLEVSEPRMHTWWVQLLLDRDAIREQLKLSREQEPSRYEGATDDWADQAPLNLNTYLKNLLESDPDDVRSISKRNKRFAVLFGPRCFSIFHQLEFSEQVLDRNGVDEGVFTPNVPAPPGGPSGATELGTYRAYLEDVRAEVQCLIHKAGQGPEGPTLCTSALLSDLGCSEVVDVSENPLVNTERYKMLGVLPTQSREVIVNAYKRQWDLLPTRRRTLVDNLMAIANDIGEDQLSDYAMTQSSVFDSQLQRQGTSDDDGVVSQALNFLGLQPPNNYSADSIIEAFRLKLARDPADAVTARSMLMLIARTSTDDSYQAALLMESDSKMSLDTAATILGLDVLDVPWQTAAETASKKLERSKGPEETEVYLDALDAMAVHTDSPTLKQAALELRQANGFLGSSDSRGAAAGQPVDLALPVGLHNIGNTCYLNSLLQYLFTVKPIRDIVLNYEDSRLDLTDESIKARLLGGNKMQMDRGEAVVAQAFAQELATLFRNLQSSDQAATRPSQRLANAVLLSTHTLLHSPKQPAAEQPATALQPPPLPARPSPALPTNPSQDVEMTSSASVPESMDADRSYEKVETTAIERETNPTELAAKEPQQDVDIQMADVEQAVAGASAAGRASETTHETSTAAEQMSGGVATDDAVDSVSVDQKQDVEEVMGSIINRLQAAIRPSSIDGKTGIQLEKIMETFFVTTVNYTKKFDENIYQHEISFDRSITAFPAPDGPCSLYDALGRNFDQQILEESKLSRYTAIKTLPPVLHVLIQRSQSMGSKNGNPVVIPEILYLDRYMDAPHDSPVFRRRVEDWALNDRIADLKSQLGKADPDLSYMDFLDACTNGTQGRNEGGSSGDQESPPRVAAMGDNWDFDGPVEDDFLLEDYSSVEARGTHAAIRGMMDKELVQREKALEQHLDSMKSIPYRLHAVICHRGHLMSGHYWVWICDFEDRVWRWYNDADVKENRDTAEVLQTLSTSGEPYFLCYVRDEDKHEYVDVPKRQRPTELSPEEAAPPSGPTPTDADGDVKVLDAEQSTRGDVVDGDGESPPQYRIE
ncbi:ubiquitin carboxyl-terminal hydrolase [Hirsutella rhossiliensis]|uniref:ubiquitinyl hydrolase 1 n=1 Tax=Hirsutella rhossiliensis TaxID=111463 RepID=A0A9P8SK01_9HYPO|nr:ubiquitin carboxyl-terminal hydrolase domain-containing protein [Hirsutella rhossiliensis]KAH0965446.1 ubiquitin carboxyl-terminal hydrolase domain-containing protein [Hirsutella rhossiliensis]